MGKEGIIIIRQRQLENENENACAAAVVVSVTNPAGLDWTDADDSVRCFGLVRAEYNAGIETLNRDFWVLLGES